MQTANQRTVVQHGLDVERPSIGEIQQTSVLGTVLEIPHDHIMQGFVSLDGGVDAIVWRRVLKESGQKHEIRKGSRVECSVLHRPDNKPLITRIKLAPALQGAKQL